LPNSIQSTQVAIIMGKFALFNAYDEEFDHKPLTTKGGQVSHANVLFAFSAMCGIDTT